MSSSLAFRCDERSVEVAADNIMDFTERENVWAEALRISFREEYRKPVHILHNGVDNTGKLIPGKLKNYNPDFKIFIPKVDHSIEFKSYSEWKEWCDRLIEMKTIPEWAVGLFSTYKVCALDNCVKKDATIVTPTKDKFYWIPPLTISDIRQKFPAAIYPNFSPNDPAIRITWDKFQEYLDNDLIKIFNWSNKAQEFIENIWALLSRPKRETA